MKYKVSQNIAGFDFGKMLKQYIDRNRIAKSELARKIEVNDSQILAYQKRASLQLNLVLRLSNALKHNFFLDIAATLPATYTTDAPIDDSKDQLIADLQQEIVILKAKVEVLLEKK